MTNIGRLLKRVCAYVIDLFIVLIIASIVSSIPALNKNMDDYQKTYDEYEEEYTDYAEYIKLLEKSYEDEELTKEEYEELTTNEIYKEIIISKYEDEKISKGEYKEIVAEINEEFDLIAKDYVYILNKKGIYNSVITLVCTLLYFGIIQYFLKGQTVGKKILKLKVVSASKKEINILNYLLRSLVVNDVLLNVVGVLFLAFSSRKIYTQADSIISTLISIVEAVIIFLVMTREDGRGLHDLMFNTKVIAVEEEKEPELKEKSKSQNKTKIIEATYEEEGEKHGKQKRKK